MVYMLLIKMKQSSRLRQRHAKNVKVYENGGRAATTTFVQRGIGDVLVTFENEANLAATDFGAGQVDIVYPKYSIKSESPVAVVKTVTDKRYHRRGQSVS